MLQMTPCVNLTWRIIEFAFMDLPMRLRRWDCDRVKSTKNVQHTTGYLKLINTIIARVIWMKYSLDCAPEVVSLLDQIGPKPFQVVRDISPIVVLLVSSLSWWNGWQFKFFLKLRLCTFKTLLYMNVWRLSKHFRCFYSYFATDSLPTLNRRIWNPGRFVSEWLGSSHNNAAFP